jgi:hypothetical protein
VSSLIFYKYSQRSTILIDPSTQLRAPASVHLITIHLTPCSSHAISQTTVELFFKDGGLVHGRHTKSACKFFLLVEEAYSYYQARPQYLHFTMSNLLTETAKRHIIDATQVMRMSTISLWNWSAYRK